MFVQRFDKSQIIDEYKANENFQIYFKLLTGTTITMSVNLSTTVLQLKRTFSEKVSVPLDTFQMFFLSKDNVPLLLTDEYDHLSLAVLKITKESKLMISFFKLRGGGVAPLATDFKVNAAIPQRIPNTQIDLGIGFESPQRIDHQIQLIEFSKSAPKWLEVIYGLNLYGKCESAACAAQGQYVYIKKGMGTFDLGWEMYNSKCPACDKKVQEASRIGFYNCNYQILATMIHPEAKEIDVKGKAIEGKYTTFPDCPENEKVKYAYVRIIAS